MLGGVGSVIALTAASGGVGEELGRRVSAGGRGLGGVSE